MSLMSCSKRSLFRQLKLWGPARRHVSSTTPVLGIVKSEIPDLDIPEGNFFNTVFANTAKWDDKIATECSITGRNYTYGTLIDKASRWAGMLRKLGVNKGDVVAVCLTNCPEYPIALFGAMSIGACLTTVSVSYTADEICRQLANSNASVIVGEPSIDNVIQDAVTSYKKPIHVVMNGSSTVQGALNFMEILEDPTISYADPVQLSGDEIALLPFSSGTTGPPKGVALSHNALSAMITTFVHPYTFGCNETTGEHQEVFNCVLPFYHIYGLAPIMSVGLHKGIKLITVPKFDSNTFVSTIKKNKVSHLHLVPPLLNFLINSPTATSESLSSLKSILCGAAPVPPSGAQAIVDKVGRDVFFQEGFGMTETQIVSLVPCGIRRLGTIGKLLPNVTAKTVDLSTGETLLPNQEGEICIKTPAMMSGYHNNEKATAETIDAEGWLHTGDVGFHDDEGFFKIVDRCKELIKVKGLQVSPSELEDIIRQHPDVLDVGVLGIPHDRHGEVPKAFIVAKSDNIKDEDINKFLEPKISSHKRLVGGIDFVDSLPKSPTGKLLRRELKKLV